MTMMSSYNPKGWHATELTFGISATIDVKHQLSIFTLSCEYQKLYRINVQSKYQ